MTVYRIALTADASGPLADLSREHPRLHVEATPMGALLLVRCTGDPRTVDEAEDTLSTQLVTRHATKEGDVLTLVVHAPPSEARMFDRIAAADALLLPPLSWRDDRLHVRLLIFGDVRADVLSDILPGASLGSKVALRGPEVERELLGSGLLLPSLTRRRAEVLLKALESGYYDTPRKATGGDVARDLGIARSTFEEHLKAAEGELVRALAPVVRLRLLEAEQGRPAAGAEALRLYARFSEDLGLYVHLAVRRDRVASVSLARNAPESPHGSEHPYLARVLEHLATGTDDLRDIPLDLHVTPFERKVLELLRTVPPGEVITYGDLARKLGRPKASRAVGQVCAKNPAIIVVPCHRVVPAAGGVGNYGGTGGPATKRRLLEKEGALGKIHAEGEGRESAAIPARRPGI